jgi:hypothetical protein
MANGGVECEKSTSPMDYCGTFRGQYWKTFHRFLEGKEANKLTAHMKCATSKFVEKLCKRPEEFYEHIRG